MAKRSLYAYLDNYIVSQAAISKGGLVEHGYGQVEPNHLSAQYTGQIYAQLPAAPAINVLEQGQFVKYDYAAHTANGAPGLVNFTGEGEWMLVYNETKLYREEQRDCEFAMLKDNYGAMVYSPLDPDKQYEDKQARLYNGQHGEFTRSDGVTYPEGVEYNDDGTMTIGGKTFPATFDVTADTEDYRDFGFEWTNDPFHILSAPHDPEQMMPAGTAMVPRVFKTNVGDIFTTNLVKVLKANLSIGMKLTPGADGILAPVAANATPDMIWQVVKIYTMPDFQTGVKLMRIK